jgi:enterochelin esterase-like enzyme
MHAYSRNGRTAGKATASFAVMKTAGQLKPLLVAALLFLGTRPGLAEENAWKDDWKPSPTCLPGQDYPRINSERRAQFRVKGPDAKDVSVSIGKPLVVTKGDDGVWTITTSPLGVGFHFYRVLIDGANVADPATEIFRGGGGGGLSSAVEVPTPGEDFHEPKDVPHGEVRERWYFAKTTRAWRRIFLYTPPNYEQEPTARFPVLYLQHGGGEDERCWPVQGRVSHIMDNLTAEKKAVPMLIVMERGAARKPGEPDMPLRPPSSSGPPQDWSHIFETFVSVFVDDLVPMIDRTYRTIPDREHRAMAGLSMGGMQTFLIGLGHLDLFAYLGGFTNSPALLTNGTRGAAACGISRRCCSRTDVDQRLTRALNAWESIHPEATFAE